MNFEEKFLSGLIQRENIILVLEDEIDLWHESREENGELHEFLGLDYTEMETYIKDEDAFVEMLLNELNSK